MAHPVANYRIYDLLDVIEHKATLRVMVDLGCDEADVRLWIRTQPEVMGRWLRYNEQEIEHIITFNMKGLTMRDLGR